MKQGARLESLREILTLFLTTPQPLDSLLKSYLTVRRYIGSKDRHFIQHHMFDIFRHWTQVTWAVALEPRTLVLSYLSRILKWTSQDFDQNLEISAYAFARLTNDEKQFCTGMGFGQINNTNSIDGTKLGDASDYVQANVPGFLWSDFQNSFDSQVMEHAKALCREATLDLRVNTLKTTRAQALESLKNLGIDAAATPYAETGIRLSARLNLDQLPLYKSGHLEVQDEGSQCLAHFCQVQPQDTVLDLCAGAGGKTLALAALMNNQGKIVATDIDDKRLRRSHGRLERAGVRNVAVKTWPLDLNVGCFDVVLVDSPCSGSGTWRRAPDLRARWTPQDHASLLAVQRELLDQASDWVMPGGRLIYATCSVLFSENEQQVNRFLGQHRHFQQTRTLKIAPLTHQTDGFYGVELVRNPSSVG